MPACGRLYILKRTLTVILLLCVIFYNSFCSLILSRNVDNGTQRYLNSVKIFDVHRAVFCARRGDGAINVYLDGDEVDGGGGEVAYVFDSVAALCPAYPFCFGFLGTIGAHNSNINRFFCVLVWHGAV